MKKRMKRGRHVLSWNEAQFLSDQEIKDALETIEQKYGI
jgi:hypothetical protein